MDSIEAKYVPSGHQGGKAYDLAQARQKCAAQRHALAKRTTIGPVQSRASMPNRFMRLRGRFSAGDVATKVISGTLNFGERDWTLRPLC